MGFAGNPGGPNDEQQRLVVPLFATSSVTGAGLPVLHAFLSRLQPTIPAAADTLQVRRVCFVSWYYARIFLALLVLLRERRLCICGPSVVLQGGDERACTELIRFCVTLCDGCRPPVAGAGDKW